MRYLAACHTDKGRWKTVNQDSLLFLRGEYGKGEAVLAVICDGMGGLEKGELASGEVVKCFSAWFEETFSQIKEQEEEFEDDLYESWENLLQKAHQQIRQYGKENGIKIGTTVTALLLMQENYYFTHIGDCRLYEIKDRLICLTADQTLASLGDMNNIDSSGKKGRKKASSVLIQGLGASQKIRPIYQSGQISEDTVYLLCSDGFRHKISELEMSEAFSPLKMLTKEQMLRKEKEITEEVLNRGEKDNVSVILIRSCANTGREDREYAE